MKNTKYTSGGQTKKPHVPMVSICTPTFNRRPFIENMFQCFRNQDYPKHRMEWIIVDDGTDKIRDLVEASNIPQIRYFEVADKMTLGAKRNYMHKFARGSIIVYMDDDDYYPPDRVSHAVERLQSKPEALCAGSSEIYIYFKGIDKMYQCGPYNPNHATAGTFAFRAELLKQTSYEDHAALAEERHFLKEYTIPFVQLDPLKSILVFSHEHNTFDKRKMLENPHPDFMKISEKTVDTFIKNKNEASIKKFFMEDIDEKLINYEPGLPKMKPDVLAQIKVIEEERQAYIAEQMKKQQESGSTSGQIVLQRPGEPPTTLSQQDVVNIMQQQQEIIQKLQEELKNRSDGNPSQQSVSNISGVGQIPAGISDRLTELENMVTMLQKQLIEKTKETRTLNRQISELKKGQSQEANKEFTKIPIEIIEESATKLSPTPPTPPTPPTQKTKSEPEIFVDIGE